MAGRRDPGGARWLGPDRGARAARDPGRAVVGRCRVGGGRVRRLRGAQAAQGGAGRPSTQPLAPTLASGCRRRDDRAAPPGRTRGDGDRSGRVGVARARRTRRAARGRGALVRQPQSQPPSRARAVRSRGHRRNRNQRGVGRWRRRSTGSGALADPRGAQPGRDPVRAGADRTPAPRHRIGGGERPRPGRGGRRCSQVRRPSSRSRWRRSCGSGVHRCPRRSSASVSSGWASPSSRSPRWEWSSDDATTQARR